MLQPAWIITIATHPPAPDCGDLAWIATPPYMAHHALLIDASHGWSAEDEVGTSPREFGFVTSCADSRTEIDRYLKGDLAKLGTSPQGIGRLWITDSKISHARDTNEDKSGKIEWMKFSVEIKVPPPSK